MRLMRMVAHRVRVHDLLKNSGLVQYENYLLPVINILILLIMLLASKLSELVFKMILMYTNPVYCQSSIYLTAFRERIL